MLRVFGCILFLLLSLAGASAQVTPVEAPGPPSTAGKPEVPSEAQQSMCLLLESAARANGLPVEFFARVIWQESRFRANAVGPVTRSGKRALGVAQFMPGTAAERNLLEPARPDPGIAEISRVPTGPAPTVRQSRACGCCLQRRPAAYPRVDGGLGPDAVGDARLRAGHHWHFGRAMGQGRRRRPQGEHRTDVRRVNGGAQAREAEHLRCGA